MNLLRILVNLGFTVFRSFLDFTDILGFTGFLYFIVFLGHTHTIGFLELRCGIRGSQSFSLTTISISSNHVSSNATKVRG